MQISGNDEHSSSSLVIHNIDLLNQILLCLPVKSLLVSKSVSKQWLSLISCPRFVQNHCNKVSGLFFPTDGKKFDLVLLDETTDIATLKFQDSEALGLKIEQSCYGLLLCSYAYNLDPLTRYVYNPSTKHCRTISCPSKEEVFSFISFGLAFNPLKSLNYQVIFIGRIDGMDSKIAIYSSATSSWRLCEDKCHVPNFTRWEWEAVVVGDGCLNWINKKNDTSVHFDIDREVFVTLPFTAEMSKRDKVYFGECMGYMHLILGDVRSYTCWDVLGTDIRCGGWTPKRNYWDVFGLEISCGGWKLKYRVDIVEIANEYWLLQPQLSVSSGCVLLVMEGDGDGDADELKALIHLPGDRIISYDFKKKSYQVIRSYPKEDYQYISRHAYIESLANV